MNGDHMRTELTCDSHGARNRSGNLVQLQIEEDVLALIDQRARKLRPGSGERLDSDLVVIRGRAQCVNQCECFFAGVDIERNDDLGRHDVQATRGELRPLWPTASPFVRRCEDWIERPGGETAR